MDVDLAFSLISRAIDSGHPANGYLLVGDLKGSCAELTSRILHKLFPDAAAKIDNREHPDVHWLAPSGKSQKIKVRPTAEDSAPAMIDTIVDPLSRTSYEGGWKVGVIECADRMVTEAANALLKSLEESTPRTLFLFLTDAPDALLPTIVSRTQTVELPQSEGLLEGEEYAVVASVFGPTAPASVFEKSRAGLRLAAMLDELKENSSDSDFPQLRKAFFRTIMSFVRRWMVEDRVPRHLAFRNVAAVEDAYRQCDRALSTDAVLPLLMDRLTFPK